MSIATEPSERDRPQEGADVFVSYSRADRASVIGLTQGLTAHGKRAWVDLEDIPPSAEWMGHIRAAIESADGYLVVISPDLARSTVCGQELEHAVTAGKRIVPVLVRPTDPGSVPPALAALNWIDATDPARLDAALDDVVTALDTDLDRVRTHTKLLVRATEWQHTGEDRSLLLRGSELAAAESLVSDIEREPRPTQLQTSFVLSSRRASGRRQRGVIAVVTAMLLVAAGLSVVAWTERNKSIRNERVAEQRAAESLSRELAAASVDQLGADPERSLLLAREAMAASATPEALAALRTSLTDSHVRLTLTGHENVVSSVAYAPDGTHLLTASFDGTARVWDLGVAPVTSLVLEGHTDFVETAAFDAEASRVVTAGFDGTTRVWDAGTGAALFTLREHEGAVHSANFSPDGRWIVTGGDDGIARVWNARSGQRLHTLTSGSRPIYVATFSPDGTKILTAGDGGARLWDASSGRLLHTLRSAGDPALLSAAFDPRGDLVAGGGRDGVVRMWNGGTGRALADLRGHRGPIVSVTFGPDGKTVLSASQDNTARTWNAATGRAAQVLRGHHGELERASFSTDGRHIVTASDDGTARVWDAAQGTSLAVLSGHVGAVMDAAFSPDGRQVATAGADGTVRVWDPLEGQEVVSGGGTGSITWSSTDAEGTKVAVATDGGTLYVIDAETGRTLRTIDAGAPLTSASLSGDGTMVAAGSFDGVGRVWDAKTGKPISELHGHDAVWMAADFYGSSDKVLSWSDDGTARLWGARSGNQLHVFQHDTDPNTAGIWEAHLSPDGTSVLTTGLIDQRIRMWDAETGKERWSADHLGASGGIGAAFSPDGTLVGTVSAEANVWNSQTGQKVLSLQDKAKTLSIGFSRDASTLVTRSEDAAARTWDARTGALEAEIPGSGAAVNSVWISNDGRWLVTSADDGVTHVWDAATGEPVATYGGGSGAGAFAFFADHDHVVVSQTADGLRIDRCEVCGSPQELLALAAERSTRALTEEEKVTYLGASTDGAEPASQRDGLETLQGVPVGDGLLDPGTYRAVGVDPSLSFQVGDGWQVLTTLDQEQEGDVVLGTVVQLQSLDTPTDGLSFFFLSPGRVLDGRLDWDQRQSVRPFPADLAAWLDAQPNLDTGHPSRVRVGDVGGVAVDTTVTSVNEVNPWPPCGGCVPLIALTLTHQTGPITDHDTISALGPGEVDRWIVLDTGKGEVLVNAYAASAKEFRAFLPSVNEVLATVRIDPDLAQG